MPAEEVELKVMIAPSSFGECGSEPIAMLEQHGFTLIHNPHGRKLKAEEVIALAKDCEGILAGLEPLSADVLRQLPKLRCISRVGVGMQNVDIEAAASQGIAVRNTPDGPSQAVAELTIGMAFALLRRIPLADRNLRAGTWQKEMGFLLSGKKVGIVGLGRIGKEVAKLFLALNCQVMASDPAPDMPFIEKHALKLVSLEALLVESDLVCLHLSVSPDAPPILGVKQLACMKPTSFLLNLARGEAVDEDALFDALSEKRIAGAALDVFSVEPYHGRLSALENTVVTPHLGSYAHEARRMMEIQSVENLIEVLLGFGKGRSGYRS